MEKTKKKCPRCPAIDYLTTLKFCKTCSNSYQRERKRKIKEAMGNPEPKKCGRKPQVEAQEPALIDYIRDFASNPVYRRWI